MLQLSSSRHQARQLLDTTRGGADESALPAALAASGDEQAAAQLKDLRAGQLSLGSDVDGVKEKLGEVKQELEAVKQELAAMRQAAAEEARFTRLQRARVLVCGGEDSEDEQYNYPADQILAGLICGETEFDLGDGCITGSPHAPGEQCNEFASYMHSLTGWRFRARQLLDTARGAESALLALAASGEQAAAQLKDLRAGQLSLGSDVDGVKEKLGEVQQELEAVKQELAAMRQAAAEEARFTRLQRARVLVCGGGAGEDEPHNYLADQILAGLICGATEFSLGDGCINSSLHTPGEQCDLFASYMHSLTGWRFRVEQRRWGGRFWLLLAEEDK
eukprot:XP_001695287.1 predicted protein [Chlamydomonas reinhardtii]